MSGVVYHIMFLIYACPLERSRGKHVSSTGSNGTTKKMFVEFTRIKKSPRLLIRLNGVVDLGDGGVVLLLGVELRRLSWLVELGPRFGYRVARVKGAKGGLISGGWSMEIHLKLNKYYRVKKKM